MNTPKLLLLSFALLLITTIVQAQDNFTWDNATVYFLLTDRFENGNTSNDNSYGRNADPVGGFLGGDLQGLTQKINDGYFDDLGVNALWITAPYEQMHGPVPGYWNCEGCDEHYSYHGYYALDFTEVDDNMGTVADMQAFVDAAHDHGIRVVMDIVLNHFGYASSWDASEFGFGPVSDPNNPAWCNWLTDDAGNQWVRAGETSSDYCSAPCEGGDLTLCLSGLPDVRTELTNDVGLPRLLQTKWDASKESQELNELNTFFTNTSLPRSPRNHIIKWLTDWVRDYGIDGFRIDTYKHVEREVWGELKVQAQDALDDWKAANPSKVLDDNDFWMVGEWFGHGPDKNVEAATVGGTDALINFQFQGQAGDPTVLDNTYSSYASIASDPEWNFLSYISSHDKDLFPDRNNLFNAGTSLLMAPGAVQIFYGDETQRLPGNTGTDQDSRSYMNWGSINTALLSHWQKLGTFRKNHPAIGAGSHAKIADNPYTFKREYSSATACDLVIVAVGANGSTTIDVSSAFSDGTEIRDYYTGSTTTVSGGNATFTAGSQGVILIERVGAGDCPPNVSFVAQAPNAPTDCYDETSITVGIEASIPSGVPLTIYYTNDGSDPTTASAQYSSPFTFGDPTDITLKAIACVDGTNNCSPIVEKRYLVGTLPSFKVYFKKPADWTGTPNIYHWEAQPVGNLADQTWPGTAMTLECNDWYSYTFDNILSTNVIFNNGSSEGTNQTNNLFANQDSYYDDPTEMTANYSLKLGIPNTGCTDPIACFVTDVSTGTAPLAVAFDAACSTTPSGTTISSYSWDFGDGNTGTGANVSHTFTANGTYTVTLTITNSEGETDTHITVITVSDIPNPSGIKVYFEKPAEWNTNVNIHYFDAVPANSATATMWPGDAMTDEGNGWYSFMFPNEVEEISLVFNIDAAGQTVDLVIDQTAWFPLNCAGLGGNGNWVFSDPLTVTPQTFDVFFENTAGWSQPKIYYWEAPSMPTTTFPGEDMTFVSGDLWKFTFTNTSTACLLFSDGNDSNIKTADLSTAAPGGTFNYGSSRWEANIILPIDLASFEATSKNCVIALNWKVYNENNLSYYDIQKSQDGTRFTSIERVIAKNNGTFNQSYEFIDKNPNDAYYYRIKSVEKDGTATFSALSYVQMDCLQDFFIHPNPFNDQINIQLDLPIDMDVTVQIFNAAGQEVGRVAKTWLMTGAHALNFDTSNLPNGVYMYRLTAGNRVLTKKLVKM